MENIFTTLPSTALGWIALIGFFVFGAVAVYGLFDKRASERKKEVDGSEDRLIDILKKTVDELEKKVDQQTLDIEELSGEVEELRKENRKYIEIFQGRDEQTKEFYKQAYAAMDTIKQSHDILTTVAESIKNTNSAMEKLIGVIEKSIEATSKVAIKS